MEKRWLIAVALTLVAAMVWISSSALSGAKSSTVRHSIVEAVEPSTPPSVTAPPAMHPIPELSGTAVAAVMAPSSREPVPAVIAAPVQSEGQIMAKLHELAQTNPEASLALAREGNARFPDSSDAAERGWIVVKALTNMRRFDEAHSEAETMVPKYRGTSWANDVERHVLVYPQ